MHEFKGTRCSFRYGSLLVFNLIVLFSRRHFSIRFHANIDLNFDLAVRIGAIYLLSGFGGSILSSLFIQRSISVGASGALFGLLGAMLSELITNWNIYTHKVGMSFSLAC